MKTVAKAWLSVALIWTACGSDAGNDMTGTPGAVPSTQPPATMVGAAGAGAAPMQATMSPAPTQTTPTTATTPSTPTTPTQPAQPTMPAQMMPTTMDPPAMMPSSTDGLALDECGLDTGFAGDQYCIKPPPADKGF